MKNIIFILLLLALFSCKEKKAEFNERNLFFEITNKVDTSVMKESIMMVRYPPQGLTIHNRSEQSIYILCQDVFTLDILPASTREKEHYFRNDPGAFYVPKTHLMFLPKKSKISLHTFLHDQQLAYANRLNFSYSMDTIRYKKILDKATKLRYYSDSLFKKDTILKRRQILFIKNNQNVFEYKGIGKEIKKYDDTTSTLPFPKN